MTSTDPTPDDGAVDGGASDDDTGRIPTVSVSLPAPVRAAPDDELAVTIVDTPVDPVALDAAANSVPVAVSPGSSSPDATPLSRRDRLDGRPSSTPESPAMLTAERLLGTGRGQRPRPEGRWPALVYAASAGRIDLGDSPAVRQRKAVDARIRRELAGGTRFVPVLTRKGGVGKTTVTALLGMALADVREDRIVAIDANPDRGTLAERIAAHSSATVRDVVHRAASISSFNDFADLVSRDDTRLDVLASDADPMLSEAFDGDDYNVVADLCARYYSIALTDCGTGIVHSVMRPTLQRADSLVVVSGGSVDEARLASETLTWLEANGYGDLVRGTVVALNTATHATDLVKLEEIEAHFASRVRAIVRIPYDPVLAAGAVIDWNRLTPLTRESARHLAALVVDGLPTDRDRRSAARPVGDRPYGTSSQERATR